ncbi:D-Ala-D-Ala carboxypeptidase family metallohydrolase [Jannaschia rubra]|uniref:D-Ala-D-Ala carboxypeptidase family metallohydrolase n=1 Tax=Jannaschia rubra TaxID=282197 RepID=UPI002491CE32|nr:D-Ala-D-Ala carboxypeptidase family metallohydrolase [Jannaschia rubra]
MPTTVYERCNRASERTWRWPNSDLAEIACRGTGKLLVNEPGFDELQALRDRIGRPLIVSSAYRSPEHDRAVGDATRSKHFDGAAFDIAVVNHDLVEFEAAARKVGFPGFARGRSQRAGSDGHFQVAPTMRCRQMGSGR